MKLHLQLQPLTSQPLAFALSPETTSDNQLCPASTWRAGSLYLIDLGYSSGLLFHTVDSAGAFFLSRLKSCFRPVIEQVHHTNDRAAVGKPLRACLAAWAGKTVDVTASFWVRKPPHGQRLFRMTLRVVGLWNEAKQTHWLYVTNLPVEDVEAEWVGVLYRLRWEIEIFFRVCKSTFSLGECRSKKREIREIYLLVALVRAALAMRARRAAVRGSAQDAEVAPLAWSRLWASWFVWYLHTWTIAVCQPMFSLQRMARLTQHRNHHVLTTRRRLKNLQRGQHPP